MPINFGDEAGNLFTAIGRLGKLIMTMRQYQTDQDFNFTDETNGAVGQFNANSDIQAQIGSAWVSQLNTVGSIGSLMQTVAQNYLNRICFDSFPQIAQTFEQVNLQASLTYLIQQMVTQGATVLQNTITATPTTFNGVGNGILVFSIYRPEDGRMLEQSFAETMLITCSQDSYIGGATAGNEALTITGAGQQTNLFAWDWPLGSNCSLTINAIDGDVDTGSGNILTNSGFADWTANVPDQWELTIGTAGTNISKETSIVYGGSGSSVKLTGDGSGTLTSFQQEFNNATDGTSEELSPLTQYGINLFIRRDGVAAAAGVLTIDLIDDNDDVIEDQAGVANSYTIDLTALTTVFTAYNVSFRLPQIMPDTYFIRFRLSTALTNGRSVYIDKAGMGLSQQTYTGGPYVCSFSGDVNFAEGDWSECEIQNQRGGGGSLNTFQTLMDTLLGLREQGYILPSSTVPSLSDTMITR